jgi:hypothetical protein
VQKKTIISIIVAFIIMIAASLVIMFFARGYRVDISTQNLQQTGILSINSTPDGALIYVNNVPKDATNNSVTGLKAGEYSVRLEKAGYQTWEKQVPIETGRVSQINALLISLFPEIRPLTITGGVNPVLSPDRQKIIYLAAANTEPGAELGIWLLNLSGRPFNILSQPTLLLSAEEGRDFSSLTIQWSPDSQNILIQEGSGTTYLVDTQSKEVSPINSLTEKEILLAEWEEEKVKTLEILADRFPEELRALIPQSSDLIGWSPDQTKILISEKSETAATYKIIDFKPTEYVPLAQDISDIKIYNLAGIYTNPEPPMWYPDSRHLLSFEPTAPESSTGSITIMELDGANKKTIFSGQVKTGEIFPHPDGSKIIILTNFTNDPSQENLYSISLY